jgi:hypothetical protein
MIIKANDIIEMVDIVEQLVVKGLLFVVNKKGNYWEIELTGGH